MSANADDKAIKQKLAEMEAKKSLLRKRITESYNEIEENKFKKIELIIKKYKLNEQLNDYEENLKEIEDYCAANNRKVDNTKLIVLDSAYESKWKNIKNFVTELENRIENQDDSIREEIKQNQNEVPQPSTSGRIPQQPIVVNTKSQIDFTKHLQHIKPFSGNFVDFPKFFISLQDTLNKVDMTKAMKLEIIREKLDKNSQKFLRGLSEEDYDLAIKNLKDHYFDPYRIQHQAVEDFRKVKPITNTFDRDQIEDLLIAARNNYRLLVKANASGFIMETFKDEIVDKLSSSLLRMVGNAEDRSISEIIQLIEDDLQIAKQRNKKRNVQQPSTSEKTTLFERRPTENKNGKAMNDNKFCHFCLKSSHRTIECYKQLSTEEKKKIIKINKLCANCFESGHFADKCSSPRRCRYCNKKHDVMFCNKNKIKSSKPVDNDERQQINQILKMLEKVPSISQQMRPMLTYNQQQTKPMLTYNQQQVKSIRPKEPTVAYPAHYGKRQNQMPVVPRQNYLVIDPEEPKVEKKQPDQIIKKQNESTSHQANVEKEDNDDNESTIGSWIQCMEREALMANKVSSNDNENEKLLAPITVKGTFHGCNETFLLDTGSNINIITPEICGKLEIPIETQEATIQVIGTETKIMSVCYGRIKIGTTEKKLKFYICNHPFKMILLGRAAIADFNLYMGTDDDGQLKVYQKLKKSEKKYLKQLDDDIQKQIVKNDSSIENIIEEFHDVFSKDKNDIGRIKGYEARIYLDNEMPITCKAYPCSEDDQQKIDQEIEKLSKMGLIEKSNSPFCFPVVLVDKKDEGKKTRLCIDYRKLNEVTKTEHYPMPKFIDIQDRLLESKIFSTLDISQGFHHIKINMMDRYKTSFVTKFDQYQWKVMPFGLKNAPMIFQRIIWSIIKKHDLHSFAHNYIDDIIIFSKSKEEHIEHLKLFFKAMKEENIKLKFSKCQFGKETVVYLGHKISHNGISPTYDNVSAILKANPPTNIRELRGFLGQIHYYHRFIPNRINSTYRLTELLKKNVKWEWTPEHQKEFEDIKKILASKPILKIFDPKRPIKIYTDASKHGIGAVMKQVYENNEEYPVSYFSKKLLPYQTRYSASEIECLAVLEAIEHWHYKLIGREFLVITDHKPLEGFDKTKKPRTRLFNWALRLNQYQFKIKYRPGIENHDADFLSRHPINELKEITSSPTVFFANIADKKENIQELQKDYKNTKLNKCYVENGIIYRAKKNYKQVFIPKEAAIVELKKIHNDFGHIGCNQLSEHFSRKFYTPNLMELIKNIIASCETCLATKKSGQRLGYMGWIGPAKAPFEIIHIDTVGGFTNYGSTKKYLHLAIDAYSRFVWSVTSKTQSSKDFINLIKKIQTLTNPKLIVADQYPGIKSSEFKMFLKKNGIKITFTPKDNPSSNGIVERVNQTISDRIRQKIYEKAKSYKSTAWSTMAEQAVDEYNRTIHSVTKYTPIYLLTGYDPDNLFLNEQIEEARELALMNTTDHHNYNKFKYDSRRKSLNLKPGEEVFISKGNPLNRKKLDSLFEGPYPITKLQSQSIVEVNRKGKIEKVHLSKVKPMFQVNYGTILMMATIFGIVGQILSTSVEIPTADPILWRKTEHSVMKGYENRLYLIKLISPCTVLNGTISPKAVIECDKIYQSTILQTLETYCTKSTDLDLIRSVLKPKRKRQAEMIITGIKLAYENWDKILHVGQAVIGFASNWITKRKIDKLAVDNMKNTEMITTALNQQQSIYDKVLKALEEMTNQQNLLRKDLMTTVKVMQVLSAVENRLQLSKQNLIKLFMAGQRRQIADEIVLLFPQLFNSSENYRQWEYMGCEIVKDELLTLEFLAPMNYDQLDIFAAQAFVIFKEVENNICKYKYGGPQFMLFNRAKDCVKELNIAPLKESQSFFINSPETCGEKKQSTRDLWEEMECHKKELMDGTDPEEIQIHYNDEFLYVYCYNQSIMVFNMTMKCQNKVYKLSPKQQFRIGNYNHEPEFRRKFGTTQFEIYENEILNAFMFESNSQYEKSSKDLNSLLNQEDGTKSSDVWFYITITLMVLILFIIGVGVVFVYYWKFRTKPHTNEPIELTIP